MVMKIGIISDTHGNLPEKALELFKGVDAILHAGDIGSTSVIGELEQIAKVFAVAGNMDGAVIRQHFPRKDFIDLDIISLYLIHEPYLLDIEPKAAGIDMVVFGHTHTPYIEKKDGVLFLNPGSVSMPRLGEKPSVMLCDIDENKNVQPKIIYL